MIGIGKLNYPMIGLRVGLGVLSIVTVGGPFLLLLLPRELWPDFIVEYESRELPTDVAQRNRIVMMASWFVLCSLSASLFALSLLVKRISRSVLRLALPWTGAMILTGVVAVALFALFVGFFAGRNDWVVGGFLGGAVAATITGWWFLLRGRRFKEATNDVDPLWSLHVVFLCGGYIAVIAGFAYLVAFFRGG